MAEHRPISVESEVIGGLSGVQQITADHRSMFDQTLARSRPMYERCSPMYERCNIHRPIILEHRFMISNASLDLCKSGRQPRHFYHKTHWLPIVYPSLDNVTDSLRTTRPMWTDVKALFRPQITNDYHRSTATGREM